MMVNPRQAIKGISEQGSCLKSADNEKLVNFAALPLLQKLPEGGRGGHRHHEPIFRTILNVSGVNFTTKA